MIKKEMPESHIRIFVDEMRVNVRIGLYPSENKPQPLVVNITLYADAVSYLKGAVEASIIDYKQLHDAVKGWEGRAHVKLIEDYLRELLVLAFSFKPVQAVDISIAKAEAFAAAKGAGVAVSMTRDDFKKL